MRQKCNFHHRPPVNKQEIQEMKHIYCFLPKFVLCLHSVSGGELIAQGTEAFPTESMTMEIYFEMSDSCAL